MEEKQGSNKQNTPQPEGNLMDTQRLLLGEPAAEGNFALEDILEEFEGVQPPPAPEEQAEASSPSRLRRRNQSPPGNRPPKRPLPLSRNPRPRRSLGRRSWRTWPSGRTC